MRKPKLTFSIQSLILGLLLSTALWVFILVIYHPLISEEASCNDLALRTSDLVQEYGYPFTMAERKLTCVGADTKYGPYTLRPAGILAEAATLLGSTAILILLCSLIDRKRAQ